MAVTVRAILFGLFLTTSAAAQQISPSPPPAGGLPPELQRDSAADTRKARVDFSLETIIDAAIALPLATALGAALALRPRRRGTPRRSAQIVQTQIILAVIGALVMLVVGSSLARAFGVVGAAGLVRYRARVEDPKDAGVMLSTLAVGLASGVGMHLLAVFAAGFVIAVLWVIESFEPDAYKLFSLKVTTKNAEGIQSQVETLLRKQRAAFELRKASETEMSFQVRLPITRGTDVVTKAILDVPGATGVDWAEEKPKPSTTEA